MHASLAAACLQEVQVCHGPPTLVRNVVQYQHGARVLQLPVVAVVRLQVQQYISQRTMLCAVIGYTMDLQLVMLCVPLRPPGLFGGGGAA